MSQSKSQWLRNAIKKILLPEFVELGFELRPLYPDERESRELMTAFPFGRHFRNVDGGVEIVEVQVRGGVWAEFRISFGFFPNVGVYGRNHWNENTRYPIESAELSVLDLSMDLCRRGTKGKFFRVWYWPWQTPKKTDFEKLVHDVVELLPQIEAALKTGEIGPNVYFIDLAEDRTKRTK